MRCRALTLLVTCVVPAAAFAGVIVIPGGSIDVTDVSRFAVGVVVPRAVVDVTEVSRHPYDRRRRPDLCGMRVVARTRRPGGDAAEWNMLFSVFTYGKTRIGGVSAGSFTSAPETASGVPRGPITRLLIAIEGAGESATIPVLVAPNAERGVVAELPESFVEHVWNALDSGTRITVHLRYHSGAQETLQLRTLGTQLSRWYHGRNSPAMRCLATLAPTSGPDGPLREMDHPW